MEHVNPNKDKAETKVVSSIKVIEEEYEVQRPIFRDVEIERPSFKEVQVELPTGFDKFAEKAGTMIADVALSHIIGKLEQKLDAAISERIKEIKSPKIVEEIKIVEKPVEVERPVFKDVEVKNAVIEDVRVRNAVVENVPVKNAVVTDVVVTNAKIEDRTVVNPVFKDIEIDRPVYKDKEITVIHPKYIDLQGRDVK